MARRVKSLHHNLQEGENVVFHREHVSPRNRHRKKIKIIRKFKRESRRKWKQKQKSVWIDGFIPERFEAGVKNRQKRRY